MTTDTTHLYEIINPSDAYTMRSESDLAACLACLFLGTGQYGLQRLDNDFEMPIFMFGGVEEWYDKTFGVKVIGEAFVEHKELVIAALESVMIGSRDIRRATEEALDYITDPEKRAAYLAKMHDERRSSMNDIGGRALSLVRSMRSVGGDKP